MSEATFYRHLAEAEQDEYHMIEAVKAASLDAARMILACRNTSNDPPNQSVSEAGPSRGISLSACRTAALQGLAKRA